MLFSYLNAVSALWKREDEKVLSKIHYVWIKKIIYHVMKSITYFIQLVSSNNVLHFCSSMVYWLARAQDPHNSKTVFDSWMSFS